MTARHSLAVGIALLAITGCGSPAEPTTGPPNADETAAAGAYTLVKVDGSALPTTSAKDAFLCTRGVDSGVLTLLTNPQTYTLAVGLRSTCDQGLSPASITSTEQESGIWSLSGGVFVFTRTGGASMSTTTVAYAVGSITAGVNLVWGGGTPEDKSMLFTK